jgi:ribosomal protein S16
MSVKIRLQRHGKNKTFYWVVAADARSKEMVNT